MVQDKLDLPGSNRRCIVAEPADGKLFSRLYVEPYVG